MQRRTKITLAWILFAFMLSVFGPPIVLARVLVKVFRMLTEALRFTDEKILCYIPKKLLRLYYKYLKVV